MAATTTWPWRSLHAVCACAMVSLVNHWLHSGQSGTLGSRSTQLNNCTFKQAIPELQNSSKFNPLGKHQSKQGCLRKTARRRCSTQTPIQYHSGLHMLHLNFSIATACPTKRAKLSRGVGQQERAATTPCSPLPQTRCHKQRLHPVRPVAVLDIVSNHHWRQDFS